MVVAEPKAHRSPVDWAGLLQARDRIVCSHMTSEPVALLRSLLAAEIPWPLELMLGVPFSNVLVDAPAHFDITTYGGMGSASQWGRQRTLRRAMIPYGRAGSGYSEGRVGCDVALVSLARGPDGRLYLGASHGYIVDAARGARRVIAEINAQAPCVHGALWPDDIALDVRLEVDYPIATPGLPALAPGEVESGIAAHVAALVVDGACLQTGIGSIPSAVLAALSDHRHLGLHTGMLTDAGHRLLVDGVIDNSRKPAADRLSVVGSVYGGPALYRYCHLNPAVELRGLPQTHHAAAIACLPDFVALNSAVEVDLIGQMNAEWVRGADGRLRHVGGIGGLNDFMRAAVLAPRGLAVTALPARTGAGLAGRPRIVADLSGPATVSASDADVVVTEHGVARLRDASLGERVRQMLAIAAPEDREGLEAAARARGMLE